MDVVYWSRTVDPDRDARLGAHRVDLDELFSSCDVVSLHLTHSPETDGMISRTLLESMRDNAILVNTARAEIVDNAALGELLSRGAIFGAGIDVYRDEPPQPDTLPPVTANTVLSAHVGFHTDEAEQTAPPTSSTRRRRHREDPARHPPRRSRRARQCAAAQPVPQR